ncbi:hypothetical protein BDV98DRAFT_590448 [Pterulicium gracile]|uniref:Uncharacterized protein n=1 Tax=Pterulicium gracile TaxID=1884261 RepID=A0A5C3QS17_9AGAR|nr:hypothetical protein BDV98DRAFT_590448 [Pterula gracilis]
MSSNQSGTQSPPLEATGDHKVMGASSVDGGKPAPVADTTQRADYVGDSNASSSETTKNAPNPEKYKGESLQQKMEERT